MAITDAINNYFNRFPDSNDQDILFETRRTGLSVTDFEIQYIRVIKGNWFSATPSTAVSLTELTNVTDPHSDNQAKFLGTGNDPLATVLRVCPPDAAFARNVDYVLISIRNDTEDLTFSQAFNIVHTPSLRDVLKERSGISSGAISKAGTPGLQRYTVLYSDFVGSPQQLGPEILHANIAAASAQNNLTDERIYIPIIGSYYSNGAGVYSQIQGVAKELGVTSSQDLFDAGWAGAGDEASSTGYTFIMPYFDNFNPADSGESIAINFEHGGWGNSINGADGYPFGDGATVFGNQNFTNFFNNSGVLSTKEQEDVGGGSGDWTTNEKNEIKTVLGITDTGTPDDTPADGVMNRIYLKTDNLPHSIKKNTALNNWFLEMFDASTGQPATGLTVTGEVVLDGGAYQALTNAVSEVAFGTYRVNLAAADVNGDTGMFRFSASGAKDTFMSFVTET